MRLMTESLEREEDLVRIRICTPSSLVVLYANYFLNTTC